MSRGPPALAALPTEMMIAFIAIVIFHKVDKRRGNDFPICSPLRKLLHIVQLQTVRVSGM